MSASPVDLDPGTEDAAHMGRPGTAQRRQAARDGDSLLVEQEVTGDVDGDDAAAGGQQLLQLGDVVGGAPDDVGAGDGGLAGADPDGTEGISGLEAHPHQLPGHRFGEAGVERSLPGEDQVLQELGDDRDGHGCERVPVELDQAGDVDGQRIAGRAGGTGRSGIALVALGAGRSRWAGRPDRSGYARRPGRTGVALGALVAWSAWLARRTRGPGRTRRAGWPGRAFG